MRRVLALLGLAVGFLLVTGSGAWGQASVESGWWTTAPVAVAPDAPDDGLVIQGGPAAGQPLAFAAVGYAAASGAVPTSLELTVASGSATTPGATLAVCPLTTSFFPEQGGDAANAPKYDCATKVTASPSDDGSTYTFDVSSLGQEDGLAVAVIPTMATDRVIFQHPDESSFEVTETTTSDSFDSAGSSSEFSGSEDFSTPGDASFDLPASSTSDVGLPSTSTDVAGSETPTTQAPAAAGTSGSGRQTFQQAASSRDAGDDGWARLRVPLLVALALAAAGLWFAAGFQDRPLVPES
jgi:hypothetical protein